MVAMTPREQLEAVVARVPHENHVWRWCGDTRKRYMAELSTGFTCTRCEFETLLTSWQEPVPPVAAPAEGVELRELVTIVRDAIFGESTSEQRKLDIERGLEA